MRHPQRYISQGKSNIFFLLILNQNIGFLSHLKKVKKFESPKNTQKAFHFLTVLPKASGGSKEMEIEGQFEGFQNLRNKRSLFCLQRFYALPQESQLLCL